MLPDLQAFLASAFQREEAVTRDEGLAFACAAHVSGNDRLSPAEQVDIYRRQFWLRHTDSLAEDYPGLRHVLGDDGFDDFCHAYLKAHPPCTPSLRDLGFDIPAFVDRHDGFPAARRGLAVAMARYENAFVDIFDGADVPPIDAAIIRELAPEDWQTATIVLHPRLVLMAVRHPVHRVRYDARAHLAVDLDAASLEAATPTYLALHRREHAVHYEELEPEAFALLEALRDGVALVPACEQIAVGLEPARAAEIEARVGGWFARWSAAGWIVDVKRGSPSGLAQG